MMQNVCGIYKITNLKNGKFYIGQSINIYGRWKQHTQSINTIQDMDHQNPLRRAFCKYGLKEQVSMPGEYGNFRFEILQQCRQNDLDELEYDWIARLKPEYNIMMCPPSSDRTWPVRGKLDHSCYVQYHNFDDLFYLPYEDEIFLEDSSSYIVSKKRDALRCKGDRVYLIVGMKQRGRTKKQFFLGCYEKIEEIECIDWLDGKSDSYGLRGNYCKCKMPIELNGLDGFDSFFRKTMGSFAYGLQNAIRDPFCKYIMDEKNFEIQDAENHDLKYLDWVSEFEEKYITDETFRLTNHLNEGSNEMVFFEDGDNPDELIISPRAFSLFQEFPDKFAAALHARSQCSTIVYFLNAVAYDFIPLVPDKKHIILYSDPDEQGSKMMDELSKKKNVEFMDINSMV
jgi:hypothetical protein